ncbi:MAG: tyrosine-protein phosphatase [Mycobacterium sp.]|nr:tyrosine-protein phosphatase [Mycobacterium sp.]
MTATIPSWGHDELVHGWWVIPDRLLATEYPGAKQQEKTARKLAVLREAGIDSFVDLTERGEITWGGHPMRPYDGDLDADAGYTRFPIPDQGVISDAGYDAILAHIRAELDAGRVVVVHCWGGKGRTGTVVGCWLIEDERMGYPEVLDRMQELRAGSCKAGHPVPDTREQAQVLQRRAKHGSLT